MFQSVCPSGAPTNNGNVADLLGLSTQMEVSIYLTSIYLLTNNLFFKMADFVLSFNILIMLYKSCVH